MLWAVTCRSAYPRRRHADSACLGRVRDRNSASVVGLAQERAPHPCGPGRASFQQADLTDTGLPGGSADTILCVDAFHFASSITAAADERARLLRPGGKLVITSWEPAGADPPHGHQAEI